MKNFKIGTKIMLGFGIVFLLVLVIAASVAVGNATILRQTRDVRAVNEVTSAAFETHDSFFMARIHATNFISSNSSQAWNDFVSSFNAAYEHSDRGLEIIRNYPIVSDYYESWNQMKELFDDYLASMENVRTAFAEVESAKLILEELAPEIVTVVDSMYNAQITTTREQINAGDPPGELNIKMSRIDDTVQINMLLSDVRISTARAMETFTDENAEAVLTGIAALRDKLTEYMDILRTQASIDIAQGVIDSLAEYEGAVDMFIAEQNTVAAESADAQRSGEEALNYLIIKVNDFQTILNDEILSAESTSRSSLIIVLVIAGVSAILSVIIALIIKGIITKPLKALSAFLSKAGSTGDIRIGAEEEKFLQSFMTHKDEIGQMIKYCGAFIDHVKKISEELESLATGDLSTDFEIISDADTMGISVQKMVDSLNNMFHEINSSAEQVSFGSRQMAEGAQALAQGSTEQTATVEELSSSISVIADKTKANAQMAEEAAKLATSIIGSAEKGSRQMDDMMNAVKEINDASQSISKVMKTIDEIAFQTNILSLNAAVEAARAGQHGKGFAVVAEEVRNLAAKSAQSAKETGSMIQNAIDKAELGVKIATETAESLNEIVSGINESNKLSDMIARSSDEQLEGISQINSGIDQVAQVVQLNSATAQESAAASQEMSGQSDMLQKLIMHFKLKDLKQAAQIVSTENDFQQVPQVRQVQQAMPVNSSVSYASYKDESFGKY